MTRASILRRLICSVVGAAIAVFVSAGPGIAAQSDRERTAIELNNRGIAAMNSGNFKDAIRMLNQSLEIIPGDPLVTQNLAMALNNLGVYYLSDTNPDLAISWLGRALRVYPDTLVRKNLSQAYVMKGHEEAAEGRLELALQMFRDAITEDRESAEAHMALGKILYESGRLTDALPSLTRACELNPRGDWKTLADKVQREVEGEKNNFQFRSAHFRISYAPFIPAAFITDAAWELEQAYQKHRMFLADAPKADIPVVFYSSKEKFTSTHELTSNVAGIYDGKVRLPMPDKPDWESLRGTMSHEVAHAFLFNMAGADIPPWINEGMAELLGAGADRRTQSLDDAIRLGRPLIPISRLSAVIKNLQNNTQASLAYDQSYSIIKYINSRFGMFGIRRLLMAVKQGRTESEALQDSVLMTPESLQQQWEIQIRK